MRGKKGFTIVEMLVVVAVLGVLVGIITTASSTAIRQARVKRATAMHAVLQAGLTTFYAQKGYWPGKLKTWCEEGTKGGNLRVDYLDELEADKVFREVVRETRQGNPMMDVSGLFVAQASLVGSDSSKTKVRGMDFRAAVAKQRKGGSISPEQLAYGYATKATGVFRRFIIKYNYETDSVTVMTQNEENSTEDYHKEMTARNLGSIYWPKKPGNGV